MDSTFTLSGSSREEIVSRVLEESDDFVEQQYNKGLVMLDKRLLTDSPSRVSEFLKVWASEWAIMSALDYNVMFSLFEIAHLEKGPEFMRNVILSDYREDGLFTAIA